MICLKISIFVVSNTTERIAFKAIFSCDLLENFYLCGIKHNAPAREPTAEIVVICLKISIFVVSNTTRINWRRSSGSCDLLENFYLCGIKHNFKLFFCMLFFVVICLKISIFVVSNTTFSITRSKELLL